MKQFVFLFTLLFIVLLTSCAIEKPTADKSDTTVLPSDVLTYEPSLIKPEYVAPEVDYEGKSFPIAAYLFEDTSWILGSYCEIISEEENGDPINDAIFYRNRNVEELLNISISLFRIPEMSSTVEITKAVFRG